ncbi:CpsB/CapC family capsule biosynthesis tyrosine phosphatase [uncultured Polaribacter sp.]|uniref:tyrosine-protein phosphatase n=1 Tax=uncultured Polaribacter sp. TaxID=174711 RepID=UPI002616E6B7|nr:CpsB/CapC family capsule biosynthesis tyrosine phosphatase [uncultured Polaribacter sp.]
MLFFKKKEIPLSDFFPKGFVDIHSHLLPGIDDGAKDIDDSIELIIKMRSYGIKKLITTPHVLGDVYPNTTETILEKLDLVKSELIKRNITDIDVSASAEYMIDEQFSLRLENNDILTLKDNFILVEMSYFNAPYNLYDVLFEIQLKGYKPILAHPERYIFYHNNFENFQKLKRAGCLFQLNLLSLTEQYGKGVQNTAKKLLQQNFYDFVGTDTHHKEHLKRLKSIATPKNIKTLEHLIAKNAYFK